MMTQTHMLIAAALLAKPERPASHNRAILLGSFMPDAALYGLFIWSKLAGVPEKRLWGQIYFSEPMLTLTAIENSLPLYFIILIAGIGLIRQRAVQSGIAIPTYRDAALSSGIALFALAAVTHLAGDFPVHVNDAHPHLWPLSAWKYHSMVSYWDPAHYGDVFQWVEMTIAIACATVLYKRFKARWVRALAVLAMAGYVAVPLYFSMTMGHS